MRLLWISTSYCVCMRVRVTLVFLCPAVCSCSYGAEVMKLCLEGVASIGDWYCLKGHRRPDLAERLKPVMAHFLKVCVVVFVHFFFFLMVLVHVAVKWATCDSACTKNIVHLLVSI